MTARVSAEAIDGIVFAVPPKSAIAVSVQSVNDGTGSNVLEVVLDVLVSRGPVGWVQLTQCVLDHHGTSVNDFGFRYPTDELDVDERPFDGVEVYTLDEEVLVDQRPFERLMSRLFKTMRQAALEQKHPPTEAMWWKTFIENIAEIDRRNQLTPHLDSESASVVTDEHGL